MITIYKTFNPLTTRQYYQDGEEYSEDKVKPKGRLKIARWQVVKREHRIQIYFSEAYIFYSKKHPTNGHYEERKEHANSRGNLESQPAF